ncbi:ATP binding protein, putative [Ricinus communis]|uniref:ATP binding protein, putative n=1 Tax=Ricinus communis TaxID=3988 RepID=B9RXH7_RICCO|nr:ATP binding protein, putative [Ricinus communis]
MEHWTRGQILGQGSQATVSIATVQQSGLAFAVKSAELSQSELLQKEQRILSTLSCPQIIAYEGYDVTREDGKLLFNIFLEYAPGGTLIDTIRKHGGFLDEGMIRSYARDILLGLHHLHSNGIVHCDIKGHNILVTSDGAKIADLGCARKVNQVSKTPIAGTPVYMAPEVARGEHQGFPADVWALGCTIIEMATGRPPWTTISDPVSALYQIGYSGMVPEIPSFMSKQAIDFVSKCLKRDPVERWSASELLRHAFVTEEACSVLKGNTSSNVETPTSVLDQGLWESREELEATWKSTHKNCSRSPTERIRQLAQGTARVPNWAWDDSWVTVRSKDSSSFEDFALL